MRSKRKTKEISCITKTIILKNYLIGEKSPISSNVSKKN